MEQFEKSDLRKNSSDAKLMGFAMWFKWPNWEFLFSFEYVISNIKWSTYSKLRIYIGNHP